MIGLPKRVIIGSGIIDNIPRYINELSIGHKDTLLVTGPHIVNVIGMKVKELLEDNKFSVHVKVVNIASVDVAYSIINEFKSSKPLLIIGLGGGKSIDIAKYVAYMLNANFISIPTSASHDGIASPFASLKGFEKPVSIKTKEPLAIIADTKIVANAPKRLLASGSGDVIAKFTAVLDWRLAHRLKNEYYGEYAASLALLSAKHILRYADRIALGGEEAARIVLEALISSSIAMSIAGSTRPGSGSEHLFSHALDLVAPKPALHGEQCGVGTIMMTYLHGRNWKRIKKALKLIGAPTTSKELGIPDEYIIKALTIAHTIRPERYTVLGESGLTWEAAENLARRTGVIS